MNRRWAGFINAGLFPTVTRPTPKRENLLLNLVFNIALPSLILAKLSKPELLGPKAGLVLALAFPLGYGAWDFRQRRQTNFISVIGFASVLLTGGLGLLQANALWLAVKEAAMPTIIGAAVLLSMKSRRPLVRQILLNDQVIDLPRVEAALAERGNGPAFERLLARSSYWLVASFLISAVLNFGLARYLLQSPPGTPEFNGELARMNLLSWPVIFVPSMVMMMAALWHLIGGIRRLTGLELEQVFHPPEKK